MATILKPEVLIIQMFFKILFIFVLTGVRNLKCVPKKFENKNVLVKNTGRRKIIEIKLCFKGCFVYFDLKNDPAKFDPIIYKHLIPNVEI